MGTEATWSVYLLHCRNGAYYCGATTDVLRRFAEHQSGKGARYTRANPPLQILAERHGLSHSQALRLEASVKKAKKNNKIATLLRMPVDYPALET